MDPVPERGPADPVAAVESVLRGPVGVQLGASLDVLGPARPVGAEVAAALAAVAREGLTNANKHAPGARVAATLAFEPGTVRLEIVNGLAASGSAAEPGSALSDTGGGAGLRGLRERVHAVGGRLEAGAEGRRWVLAAACPAPAIGPAAPGDPAATSRGTRA
ncbi:hypothetical protein GCM10022236_33070 [Microlunatus ginsengisoli]|uniref:histidine kinase n=1 Tax=Microlunatus ginsengisoli TaxID=363863 RepID=A0ABP7AAA1_9ACTN